MIRLFRFLGPFRWAVVATVVLLFGQSLAELYLPTLMADIIDIGVVKSDIGYIWQTGGWMLLVAAGSGLCAIAAAFLSAQIGSGFGRDLRSRVFGGVSGFSLHEFDKLGTATLITRTTNDINQVTMVLIMIIRLMIYAPIMAVGGVIMAVNKDATLSLVIVVALPILAAVIALITTRGIPLFTVMQQKLDRLNLVLREALTGIRVVRAFNRADFEKTRFNDANRDLTDVAVRVNRIMGALFPMMMLLMNLTTIAIIWFGGIRIDSGEMQVGSLMAFIQYVIQIMFSVLMMSFMFVMVPRAQVSAVRINEVLNMVPDITDPVQPKPPAQARGVVEFRNVTFSYPGAEQPALSNLSFTANPGETVAIIGGTGSGKSTLVNLIPRFYDVQEGQVLIDGVSVRDMPQETLRSRLGFVPQQAVLFTGTIAENIRYGKDDATDEEVRHAAETAQALDFITAMPEGFAAEIAQGGTNLSGGQKQRLSIARAVVRRPLVYIFDDSFSALDFRTDARLRKALKSETLDATVLIVAQRVSTVVDADRILVLEDGAIVGQGRHRELLNTCEVYREIVASQLSEEELAA
jgi:ATP-binding cassette subfamily B protein